MAVSENTRSLPVVRRQLLAGLALGATPLPPGADAQLIAAVADWRAAAAEERRIGALPPHGWGSAEETAIEAQVLAQVDRKSAAVLTAALLPAQTQAGLQAKATLLRQTLPDAVGWHELTAEDGEIRLALSLAADILRGVQ